MENTKDLDKMLSDLKEQVDKLNETIKKKLEAPKTKKMKEEQNAARKDR